VLIDLLCLVFDLGDPIRFYHMLRVFKLRSPMSIGTWAVSGFSFLSFVCFVLALTNMPGWERDSRYGLRVGLGRTGVAAPIRKHQERQPQRSEV
jgi:formate-dependent nitrite reductase membrane component NrfD